MTRVYRQDHLEVLADTANGRTCGTCFMFIPSVLKRAGPWYLCVSMAGLYLDVPAICPNGHHEHVLVTVTPPACYLIGKSRIKKYRPRLPGPARPLRRLV